MATQSNPVEGEQSISGSSDFERERACKGVEGPTQTEKHREAVN